MVIVLVARDHLAIIFSNSKEMQEAVADLAYLLGITMVLNSVQPVISGIYCFASTFLCLIMDLILLQNTNITIYLSCFSSCLQGLLLEVDGKL